jgi:hypothetical protein
MQKGRSHKDGERRMNFGRLDCERLICICPPDGLIGQRDTTLWHKTTSTSKVSCLCANTTSVKTSYYTLRRPVAPMTDDAESSFAAKRVYGVNDYRVNVLTDGTKLVTVGLQRVLKTNGLTKRHH